MDDDVRLEGGEIVVVSGGREMRFIAPQGGGDGAKEFDPMALVTALKTVLLLGPIALKFLSDVLASLGYTATAKGAAEA